MPKTIQIVEDNDLHAKLFIQLPNVSGLDAARMLKADDLCKDIPVIAVTAFAKKGDEEKFRHVGGDSYISKPFKSAYFLEEVARFLA